jgi:hypothetical protein
VKVLINGTKLSSHFPFRMSCEHLDPSGRTTGGGCRSKFLVEGPGDIYPYCSIGMGHASHTSCAVQCPVCKEWNYLNLDGYPKLVWKAVVKVNKGRKMCPYPHGYRHHSEEYAGTYP